MRRLLRMHTGDPYSLDAVLQSQYVLDDSQYFSSSEVVSEAPNPITHTIPITVKAKEKQTQQLCRQCRLWHRHTRARQTDLD